MLRISGQTASVASGLSGRMRLLGGFARWFPGVWRPFFDLWEIITYIMPLSLGTYEDM